MKINKIDKQNSVFKWKSNITNEKMKLTTTNQMK